ncbi:neutral/alkaline non-lysosomal ceramidase N-terminal domain-containing protein [Paenibacillus sp. PAMC21692]|uniref:neutral/alkaline non-lysosomal ceramidase N-terminal domain-containing protein n=1 Tax=Paenibacillus sp. PAMC21692 TaxID=2762320 RepID=UPI00164CE8AE|nr:neutral/alkaline non-lysosomal ceramidase N-terminal domain-containing protein [Paenibacillus sp. PAMC21692]QNK56300.1 neutral/alkaline non-lysosomal ceramidase N-terminal domain-containing protein [Paenibacillus sp. PAMC21692]
MQFSLAKEDITPDKPIVMHGFGDRTRKSEGVLDPLYMKTALLVANRPLLIVTIDALGSDHSFIVGIKEGLRERFGLKHEEVLINFSHTHHSFFLTGVDPALRRGGYSIAQNRWAEEESELDYTEDEALFHTLRDTLLRMVSDCYDRMQEGELWIGCAESDFAVSRRRPNAQGGVDWAPYFEGELDRDLFVLKLVDRAGAVQGILYSYGCHTTAMSSNNYLLSNDFAGYTSEILEMNHPGAVAMFLQGCAGELKPRMNTTEHGFTGSDSREIRQVGTVLAEEVGELMHSGQFRKVDCHFQADLRSPLLYTERFAEAHFRAIIDDPQNGTFEASAGMRSIQAIKEGTIKDRIPYYISIWQLDDKTRLISLEGEVSTEYSLLIKRLFGRGKDGMIVLGYTNGVFSYVPTRKMLREGGYEAECNYFFGLHGNFVPEIEDIIIGQLAQALSEDYRGQVSSNTLSQTYNR